CFKKHQRGVTMQLSEQKKQALLDSVSLFHHYENWELYLMNTPKLQEWVVYLFGEDAHKMLDITKELYDNGFLLDTPFYWWLLTKYVEPKNLDYFTRVLHNLEITGRIYHKLKSEGKEKEGIDLMYEVISKHLNIYLNIEPDKRLGYNPEIERKQKELVMEINNMIEEWKKTNPEEPLPVERIDYDEISDQHGFEGQDSLKELDKLNEWLRKLAHSKGVSDLLDYVESDYSQKKVSNVSYQTKTDQKSQGQTIEDKVKERLREILKEHNKPKISEEGLKLARQKVGEIIKKHRKAEQYHGQQEVQDEDQNVQKQVYEKRESDVRQFSQSFEKLSIDHELQTETLTKSVLEEKLEQALITEKDYLLNIKAFQKFENFKTGFRRQGYELLESILDSYEHKKQDLRFHEDTLSLEKTILSVILGGFYQGRKLWNWDKRLQALDQVLEFMHQYANEMPSDIEELECFIENVESLINKNKYLRFNKKQVFNQIKAMLKNAKEGLENAKLKTQSAAVQETLNSESQLNENQGCEQEFCLETPPVQEPQSCQGDDSLTTSVNA
ncbi:hypothetical protein J7L02_03980, partial [Candidatus Woesearchaeota archaeon]|nr:hypothetical protein [Candidatus Woesearchaeota archaeon]